MRKREGGGERGTAGGGWEGRVAGEEEEEEERLGGRTLAEGVVVIGSAASLFESVDTLCDSWPVTPRHLAIASCSGVSQEKISFLLN